MKQPLKRSLVNKWYWQKYSQAARAFDRATPYRNYLPDDEFQRFVDRYGKLPAETVQDYSVEGMERLAAVRVKEIRERIGFTPGSVLEVGPGAGFVLRKFKEEGIAQATGLDIVDELYPDVRRAGVELVLSSANDMRQVPDQSYDLVVSWNALEHIPEPEKMYNECLRVLKPGGYFFLQFGPLYYSSWGYHHHSILRCPYLHLLFPERLIREYARIRRGDRYESYLPWTNGLPVEAYAFMKAPVPYGYHLEVYESGYEYWSSDMIRRFPEIFKSKNVPFENFFVDWIRVAVSRKF
jgi:ubiquinone/menaquinone biosynthesis C-methylase UbiE